ncbi:hypothetical protein EDB87DRAFT_1696966 [Lactarius vividus]|nr:hypothetical protein EDB87DRAFT_1696966 [Lactarius vividus]
MTSSGANLPDLEGATLMELPEAFPSLSFFGCLTPGDKLHGGRVFWITWWRSGAYRRANRYNPIVEHNEEHAPVAIHMPDLQTTQEFIDLLRSSVLEDTGMLAEDVESLQNPEPGYEFVDSSPLLRSLRHFINNATASRSHYDRIQVIERLHRPDDPIMSFDQVKRRVHWLSGVVPIEHDIKPRYSPGTTKPQKRFTTIPVGPVIQALYSSHELAEKMHYLEKKLAENSDHARLNRGRLNSYDDIASGQALLDAWNKGDLKRDNVTLQFSIDGAQLRTDRPSEAWFFIWVIHNLPPAMRYKKAFYSYTGNDLPPEHLADVRDALMDDGGGPGRREYHDNSSDPGDYIAGDLQPNPNATEASGLEYLVTILSDMSTLTPSGNPRSKAAFAAELVDNLNTPASHWDGLTALHWLGLNPLVRLGAPSVAISNAVARSTLLLAQGMMALSGSIEVMQAQMTRLVDTVADLHNRPPPLHPPSLTYPGIDEDTPMPPPPPPAPAAAPATTPVPASTPRAKKQPHAKTPTPAAAPSAKAPTPAPSTKPTPPPRSSFASAVKLPARPSLVVTPCRTAGPLAPIAVRRTPQELIAHLNSVLLEGGHPVTLSAARWTAKNNLVLTAGPDTTAHHLNSASHVISDSLAVFLSADTSSPLPVLARENCKWGRLTINGIPTGASLTHGPYSPSELHAALLADNPAYRLLRLTQAPSWVRVPHSYTPGSVSSCVISFEDPSGESLRSLMAGRTLFAFGHSGELKRWKAKPRGSGAKPSVPPST